MSQCSFCGSKEDQQTTPVCPSCGSLRYPLASKVVDKTRRRQDKLKLSAAIAVAAITPGSFIVLALLGARKIKNRYNIKTSDKKN